MQHQQSASRRPSDIRHSEIAPQELRISASDIVLDQRSPQDPIISLSDTMLRFHHEPHPISSLSETGSMEVEEISVSEHRLQEPSSKWQGLSRSLQRERISIIVPITPLVPIVKSLLGVVLSVHGYVPMIR